MANASNNSSSSQPNLNSSPMATQIASFSTSSSPVILNLPIAMKLNRSNYLAWQSQIIPVLHGFDLYSFINPMVSPPSPTMAGDNGQLTLNPTYVKWHRQDQILLGWLRASLSDIVLSQVVSCTSSSQLWVALQRSFSSTSRARLTELRRTLQTLTKGSLSCTDYLQKIQSISDELTFVGFPISEEDQVTHILNGLGAEFNSFVVAITARSEPINIHDLHSLLLTHEQLLRNQHINEIDSSSSSAFFSTAPTRNKGRSSNSLSSGFQQFGNRNGTGLRNGAGFRYGAGFQPNQNRIRPRSHFSGQSGQGSYRPPIHAGPGLIPIPTQNSREPQGNDNHYKNEICQV